MYIKDAVKLFGYFTRCVLQSWKLLIFSMLP